ncbi:TRAP transporter large permease [Uliginosibacterium sediminicola]|uniref:TRAP transporter large permease protein n=1 Tax=Uliginosibacterium sediminicola TaxID=2024550 RepID=A0ABU9YTB1_9RHOO
MALTVLAIVFALLLILGVPVVFAIGLSSVAAFVASSGGLDMLVPNLNTMFNTMIGDSGMNKLAFLAIPFFIFAGELMIYGGMADKIVNFAKAAVGHVRGGLGMSNVVACTLFGGISGSAVADVSAMGSVLIPIMKKEGYDADYAVNVTTHAALVGVLTPTSLNIILFTLAAGGKVSILDMIYAGIIPAILLTACNLAAAYLVARKRGYPRGEWPGWAIVARSFAAALPGLMVIVIILFCITAGICTATESASIAVVWALFLSAVVYRSLTVEQFIAACAKAAKTTGTVLTLIGISAVFGYLLAINEVPTMAGEWMSHISTNPFVIFFLVNIILFVLGTFLDMAPTILICTPIFMPICAKFGMDPVQFGIVMLLNCALGLNTPPVGTTQFVGCAIGEISVGQVMKTILPFYGSLTATMMLITYIPALSMWLPNLVRSFAVG